MIGPIKGDTGYYLLQVDDKPGGRPRSALAGPPLQAGVSDAEYRDYVRGDLLSGDFKDYF